MRRGHFEALAPICPVCRGRGAGDHRLVVSSVVRGDEEDLLEGVLHCSFAGCRREYPVLDGLPLFIGPLRDYVQSQSHGLLVRRDLSPLLSSLLGDCHDPGSAHETLRQHLSSYFWDHYGALDEGASADPGQPGAVLRALEALIALAPTPVRGPVLDLGCGAGRATIELAARTGQPAVGVEFHAGLARAARRAVVDGDATYDRRESGLVYERRSISVPAAGRALADVWVADGTDLPFASATFGTVVGLNVLDSVADPVALLGEIERVLSPGGQLLMSCPYDWAAQVTPLHRWIGGHSQRDEVAGDPSIVLRQLLTPGRLPSSLASLALVAELDGLPWTVRVHARSSVSYRCHAVVALKS